MNRVNASNSQSTFDVAIQTTGEIEGLVQLMLNNGINSVDYDFKGGEVIEYEDPANARGQFYQANDYIFVTGSPEVQDFGDYNNDYNEDFDI